MIFSQKLIIKHWCFFVVHNCSLCKIPRPNYKMSKNESKNKIGIFCISRPFQYFEYQQNGGENVNAFIFSCYISNLPNYVIEKHWENTRNRFWIFTYLILYDTLPVRQSVMKTIVVLLNSTDNCANLMK